MKLFIKNKSIDGAIDLEQLTTRSYWNEEVWPISNDTNIMYFIKLGTVYNGYLGAVTDKGKVLIFKVFENIQPGLTLQLVEIPVELNLEMYFNLLGEDILFIKKGNGSIDGCIINLLNCEVIFNLPHGFKYCVKLAGEQNCVAAVFLGKEDREVLIYIIDGEVSEIQTDIYSISSYRVRSQQVIAKQKLKDGIINVICFDSKEKSFVRVCDAKQILYPQSQDETSCIIVNENKVYTLDVSTKHLSVIIELTDKSLDINTQRLVEIYQHSNIDLLSINYKGIIHLYDFKGNLIDTDIQHFYNTELFIITPSDSRIAMYKKNNGSIWMYDFTTKSREQINLEIINNNSSIYDRILTDTHFLIEAENQFIEEGLLNAEEDYLISSTFNISELFEHEMEDITESIKNKLEKTKLIFREKDNKSTIDLIKNGVATPLLENNKESIFFDFIFIKSTTNGIEILCIEVLEGINCIKEALYSEHYIDVKQILGNISSCTLLTITETDTFRLEEFGAEQATYLLKERFNGIKKEASENLEN